MSDQDIPKNDAEDTRAGESRNISRQELLKKGWVVPAVVAINLPTAVQAQTAVPAEDSSPDSPTGSPTAAPTPGVPTTPSPTSSPTPII